MTDRPPAEAKPPVENLPLIRQQAAVYREMEPLLDRLQKLAARRGWPLGQNILRCAVDELERLTPTTTH
jgi:hypothetical protein